MKCNNAKLTSLLVTTSLFIGASAIRADEPSASEQPSTAQPGTSMNIPGEARLERIAENPTQFVQRANQDNMTAIQLGKIAQEKGQSQGVKDFGKDLVKGHQSLNDKLTQLASQKSIECTNKLDMRHQLVIDRLSMFSGETFDKHFLNEQVQAHKRDVALYEQAASKNPDADIKSFAETSLPALREHLQMAQTHLTSIKEAAGAEQPKQ
jgi:putative membrane protein